jgi:hypothetical protein
MRKTLDGGRLATGVLVASALLLAATLLWSGGHWWLANRRVLRGPMTWTSTPRALIDTPAPHFLIETLEGDTVSTPQLRAKTLLIGYTTTCRFCEASVPNWRRIVESVCPDVEVVLISGEPLDVQRDYWAKRPLHDGESCPDWRPVIGRPLSPAEVISAYGMRGTPMHFVVEEDGSVLRTWLGAVGRSAAVDSLLTALR